MRRTRRIVIALALAAAAAMALAGPVLAGVGTSPG
jgi:hypothetical protein